MSFLPFKEKLLGFTQLDRHCVRVASLVFSVGRILNLSNCRELIISAYLHDIGKSTWPEWMFYKTPLNNNEWEIIKRHPLVGAEIVERLWPEATGSIKSLIRGHHERPGGYGYPDGINDPSLDIVIISACDTFDAMTSEREYRPGRVSTYGDAITNVAKFAPFAVVDALCKATTGKYFIAADVCSTPMVNSSQF